MFIFIRVLPLNQSQYLLNSNLSLLLNFTIVKSLCFTARLGGGSKQQIIRALSRFILKQPGLSIIKPSSLKVGFFFFRFLSFRYLLLKFKLKLLKGLLKFILSLDLFFLKLRFNLYILYFSKFLLTSFLSLFIRSL